MWAREHSVKNTKARAGLQMSRARPLAGAYLTSLRQWKATIFGLRVAFRQVWGGFLGMTGFGGLEVAVGLNEFRDGFCVWGQFRVAARFRVGSVLQFPPEPHLTKASRKRSTIFRTGRPMTLALARKKSWCSAGNEKMTHFSHPL